MIKKLFRRHQAKAIVGGLSGGVFLAEMLGKAGLPEDAAYYFGDGIWALCKRYLGG